MPRPRWSPPRQVSDEDLAAQERRRQAVVRRGQHPDLTDDGDVRGDVAMVPDAAERDFLRRWQDDGWRANFMAQVEHRQRQEPQDVQNWVGGRSYGDGQGAYRGFLEYQREMADARGYTARSAGHTRIVTGSDIARMSDAEYDACFDANGQPREGVVYHVTSADVPTSSSIDRYSARELR